MQTLSFLESDLIYKNGKYIKLNQFICKEGELIWIL